MMQNFILCGGDKGWKWKIPGGDFFHCAGRETASTVSVYFGRMYQSRYLTGMAAGMRTKTNHIGFIAPMPIPELMRGINAFALWVQRVNPQAVVHLRWTKGWDNPELESSNSSPYGKTHCICRPFVDIGIPCNFISFSAANICTAGE